jgi:TPR repeat protein
MSEEKLLKLAKAGDADAKYQLGILSEDAGKIDIAKRWYNDAVASGSAAAMNALGLLAHAEGDLEIAKDWYVKAVNNGYSMGFNNLGVMSEDPEEALKWFRAGVNAGNSLAMYNLALILQQSGEKESLDLFLSSAELGDSNAMVQMGLMAEEAGNLQEARSWYLRAIELGNIQAICNLGLLEHESGDLVEAKKHYENALSAGELWPLNNLGRIAELQGDNEAARSYYEKAAKNGDPTAVTNLGILAQDAGDSDDQDELELDGCQREEWIEVIEVFVRGDDNEIQEIQDNYPRTFEAFENLKEYGLFEIWAEWSANLEFGRGEEETMWDFLSAEILRDENGDEIDYVEDRQRLSIRDEYLPSSGDERYVFNIEGGVCAISGKAPQLSLENDQIETESKILKDVSGINCHLHETSEDCYASKCEASLITIGSGLGDGYYRAAAFNNLLGDIECVMTYFSYNWEYVESKLILGEGTIGTTRKGTLIGNLENQIPIYLGEIKSGGTLNFGDRWAWNDAGRGDDFKIVSIAVPADEYLVLGWIDALSFDPTNIRVFTVGLYRNEMKDYYFNLMEEFPVIKTFADENLNFDFARNVGNY